MRYATIALACGSMALLLGLGPALAEASPEDASLVQVLIDSADTPAEHEALASYYRREADKNRAMAEMHRSMSRHYSGGKLVQVKRMREHCDSLVKSYEQLATEYEALAKTHDEAARP